MNLFRITPQTIGSNCYIVSDKGEAVVIDPSASAAEVMKYLTQNGLTLKAILLTHGHFDHMLGLEKLRTQNPSAPVMIHADDAELMPDGHKNAFFDFFSKDRDFGNPDKLLIEGDTIPFGNMRIRVMHTPGHTKGSVCYRCAKLLFTGDTIMADSFGRLDLYSGSPAKMNHSLGKLRALAAKEDLIICPGHGNTARLSDALYKIYNRQ